MIVYKCPISGDELFTDSSPVKVVNDCIYEVTCKYITVGADDFKLDGANPSAEEAEDNIEGESTSGLNLVLQMRLNNFPISKKDFVDWAKSFSKVMLEKWSDLKPEEIETKKKSLQQAAGVVVKKFKNLDCYVGESLNADGAMGFLEHRDIDGVEVPTMIFFKDGIEAEKC